MHDAAPPDFGPPVFDSFAEILAYTVEIARAENVPEDDAIELICRSAQLEQRHLREAEPVLRALGYTAVCTRLRKLARRKRCA